MHHDKKIALVTGANKGLGFEISSLLAQKGITLMLASQYRGNFQICLQLQYFSIENKADNPFHPTK